SDKDEDLIFKEIDSKHYLYASMPHPNQSNVYISVKVDVTLAVLKYMDQLREKEMILWAFIFSLLFLSLLLNILIKLPIWRLSKSIDLILSGKVFLIRSMGFGQFKELERVIIEQNDYFEKQRVLHLLAENSFDKISKTQGLLAVVNHNILDANRKILKDAKQVLHLNHDFYIYIFDKEHLKSLIDQKICSFLMDSELFDFSDIDKLVHQDVLFTSVSKNYVAESIYSSSNEKIEINSLCFSGVFYELS
ncbi:hypothetical protein MJH12_12285, partial [bacterium]|nr:hypothetical protein [bacterium]